MSVTLSALGEQMVYYDFTAASLAAADAQMARLGPRDADGSHAAAVEYKAELRNRVYRLVPNSTNRSSDGPWTATALLESAQLYYGFVVTFPRWTNVTTLSRPIQGEWERYTRQLQLHERGHIPIALPILRNYVTMWDRLRIMGTGPNAPAAELAARAEIATQVTNVFELMANDVRQASESYDRRTRHGRLQGARLDTRAGAHSRR